MASAWSSEVAKKRKSSPIRSECSAGDSRGRCATAYFVASTARGGFVAMADATAMAASNGASSTSVTNPHSEASAAVMR